MINPFFKNKGPFDIVKLLKLASIDDIENLYEIVKHKLLDLSRDHSNNEIKNDLEKWIKLLLDIMNLCDSEY